MIRKALLWSVLVVTSLPYAHAQDSVRNVELLASSCAACHGTNGHSVGGTPSLAGLASAHIIEQMRQFTGGERPSTVMLHHASAYTTEEIELLADYFSKQK
ncbi:MAG: cytochrome C [Gammaproteobacteria bacterium]|nr:cytochrome C [Gammaproteobacteria bacterium]